MLLSKAFNDKLPRLLRFPSPPTSPPLPIIYYITSVLAPGNAEPGSHPPTKASPSIDYDEQGFPPPLTPSPPPLTPPPPPPAPPSWVVQEGLRGEK